MCGCVWGGGGKEVIGVTWAAFIIIHFYLSSQSLFLIHTRVIHSSRSISDMIPFVVRRHVSVFHRAHVHNYLLEYVGSNQHARRWARSHGRGKNYVYWTPWRVSIPHDSTTTASNNSMPIIIMMPKTGTICLTLGVHQLSINQFMDALQASEALTFLSGAETSETPIMTRVCSDTQAELMGCANGLSCLLYTQTCHYDKTSRRGMIYISNQVMHVRFIYGAKELGQFFSTVHKLYSIDHLSSRHSRAECHFLRSCETNGGC